MVIDCTLNELKVPGFSGVNPPFGTKKPEGQSITAREADANIRLPFSRQRPFLVTEDSGTTEIQAHTPFVIQTGGVTLTLDKGGFAGCKVRVLNLSGGEAAVVFGEDGDSAVTLTNCEDVELEWLGNAWKNVSSSILFEALAREIADREAADGGLDGKITAEKTDRAGADNGLDSRITAEKTDREAADGGLAQKINAVQGRGGYLMAYDFGTHTPTQDDLDAYALSQIHSDNPQDIWNGTHVKNIYVDPGTGIPDSHVWALTNTPDTDPPIHDWSDDGFDSVSEFSNDFAGVLQGTADPGDGSKDGFITAVGKFAKVIGEIAYKDFLYQVGDYYTQYPDTKTPAERGLPGSWEIWSNRAVIYGLSTSSGGSTGAYIERQKCGNPLADSDLSAGQQLASGPYAGWYVTEVVTPAGKFWGVDGGNRPAFVSGGPQGDRIRNIAGDIRVHGSEYARPYWNSPSGAFYLLEDVASPDYLHGNGIYSHKAGFGINASRIVPVGADNAPVNISVRIWRRVS